MVAPLGVSYDRKAAKEVCRWKLSNVYIKMGLSYTLINCFGISCPIRWPEPPAMINATFIPVSPLTPRTA